jgi:sarcosine oxidase
MDRTWTGHRQCVDRTNIQPSLKLHGTMARMNESEYLIIGAGGAGVATAYALAKRGASVTLLEQFAVGHDRGSSQGHSRIFRFAYDVPDYARMAMQSLKSWRALEADCGESLLTITGGLDLGPAGSGSLELTEASMTAVGATFDRLDSVELMKRFGQWRVPDDWVGLHSVDAGILNPTHCVEVIAGMARAHGANILEHTMVTKIHVDAGSSGGPRVETNRGVFAAKKLILTAGAWLPELFPEFKMPIRVTLESGVFFRPLKPEVFSPERFPIFLSHNAQSASAQSASAQSQNSGSESAQRWDRAQAYGFPMFGLPGVKIGLHQSGETVQASTRGYEVSDQTLGFLEAWMARHLPDAAGLMMHAKTCLYANTPGEDFLIDTHAGFVPGGSSDVILASPCSGHGFKFVPFLGELIADLAQDRKHEFHLERFQAKHALLSGS